ncbi:Putative adenylate kinase/UMP-CMP kinase, P-loop containing nucleoside triphosphate hydrolase [Colletotrichum destructivum]|uniref:Adenylate kinase/UMP-CMP kinase, P-loop containing nucleoside triphosphate hydrolase n=1 Tax=Colletotrichum destructivum TaxID=34406 RepID=A0AAX4IIW5_9PEZI|nr:Putative adenylate kinase/UMP-CMP kinase, P-loop containing nucleoside triphosphate hydrolase [Colletotrichum destructivum]
MNTHSSPKRQKFCRALRPRFVLMFRENRSLLTILIGDNLRTWMQANRETPLAARIQEKLDHQGFLTSAELNPLLGLAIENAMPQDNLKGILIDGFPSCEEQLNSWAKWPFQEKLPLEGDPKPDVVLLLNVTRENAEARYLARGRGRNDSAEKFTRRFAESLEEGLPVERYYRQAGLLVDIDNNGTKEENIAGLQKTLRDSALWSSAVGDQDMKSSFIV